MALNVVYIASEATPFSKTGGLADVAGSLPCALKRLGAEISVIVPFYRATAALNPNIKDTGMEVTAAVGKKKMKGRLLTSPSSSLPVYFLKCDEYFDRTHLYGGDEGDYADNLERFAFFSRASLEAMKGLGRKPDIIHSNDWQTGLIPAYLKDAYATEPFFSKTKSIFTIHNLAYQGLFGLELFDLTGLSNASSGPSGIEFWGKISLLKAGIAYADAITTVSPAYAREIQTPESGCGMDGLLKERRDDLYGILNGVDYDEWDPAKDPLITKRYSPDDLSGKAACKKALIKEFGLKLDKDAPLVGMVSRLDAQKGFDILIKAVPGLMETNMGLVILGSGNRDYAEALNGLKRVYPERLGLKIAFELGAAHRIEAGSDMFLMPSRYEPCGLNQIYSLKYGTVPIVRATGGLMDTVMDYKDGKGTGFRFSEYSPDALINAVKRAALLYDDKKAWKGLVLSGMKEDFSWGESAVKYMELYRKTATQPMRLRKT